MISTIKILGDSPFAKDANGKLKSRIGTAFPHSNILVTLPGIHAMQRRAYIDSLNLQRKHLGQPLLSQEEEHLEWDQAVDLIFDENKVLIRADPDNMPLAFEADELLQMLVPKHRINFLGVLNEKVREAIKKRGDWWRITPLPKTPEEMKRMILEARIGLSGSEIYYYSKTTGVRYLTCQKFAELGGLEDFALCVQLLEIQHTSAQRNAHGAPEVAFFAAGQSFGKDDFASLDFSGMGPAAMRVAYEALKKRFTESVEPEFREDDVEQAEWRNGMVAALLGREEETLSDAMLMGLSPEFFMQIEWLPGGCIESGELVLDSLPEPSGGPDDAALERLRDEKPRQFIFNFVREHGNLEYVNIGRVIGSLSRRPTFYGRRGVYVAVLKLLESEREIVTIIRMQKYGVHEYLEEKRSLLDAMLRSEEYTEYTLDRRLGCRQLGMNLPTRVTAKKISEHCIAHGQDFVIWSPYFERDYIRGIATDKVPPCCFENEEFALQFARLLGRAAAPNLIVGRYDLGGYPLFDDGDEVLIEDAHKMPVDIVVADHTGTFNDYRNELEKSAPKYAASINRRAAHLAEPGKFADAYLEGFIERFSRIQDDYRRHKKAFDTLFKHCPRDEGGSFAFRWEKVLERLDATDPHELAQQIRKHVLILTPQAESAMA